ncbi:AHH domain-containing protein, partial [Undibacterium sp. CY18W]
NIVNTYTENGQVAIVTVSGGNGTNGAQNGQTSYQYDAQDRVTRQTNPDGSYLAYGYDANGNITERSTVSGTVKYNYNANQQLVSVTDTANKTTSYTYDNAGRLATTTVPNGITASYAYDPNGRLQQVLHQKANGNIVAGSRYTLAVNGQRTKIEEFDSLGTVTANVAANPVRTTSYQYDGVNRLTQELVKDRAGVTTRTVDYQYDKVGNRSQKAEATLTGTETTVYSYDSNDRLTQEIKSVGATQSAISYTWDDKGNLSTKTVAGQVTVYVWNADNRLVEVKQGATQASAATVVKYSYDALGNRVQKTEADKVTTYLTDSTFAYAQTVQESIAQGTTTQAVNYVWGNGLIQQSRAGQNSYYHADGLGSTKALTDETGNATDAYQYDAFGTVLNHAGTTQNAYRYTGEYFDDAITLQYNRSRWYDANVGRFVSMDTYPGARTKPITINKYIYANANPIGMRDPSGRASLGEQAAAGNIASTLGNLQANFGFNLMNAAMDPSGFGAASMAIEAGFFLAGPVSKAAAKLIGNVFLKGKTLKFVAKADSTILGDNLKVLGSFRCSECQAHHLVPGTAKVAEEARQILRKHDININSPLNGVWLKGASSPAEWAGAIHNGRHLDEYGRMVSKRLKDADIEGGKLAVIEELQRIRNELFEEGSELFGLI